MTGRSFSHSPVCNGVPIRKFPASHSIDTRRGRPLHDAGRKFDVNSQTLRIWVDRLWHGRNAGRSNEPAADGREELSGCGVRISPSLEEISSEGVSKRRIRISCPDSPRERTAVRSPGFASSSVDITLSTVDLIRAAR